MQNYQFLTHFQGLRPDHIHISQLQVDLPQIRRVFCNRFHFLLHIPITGIQNLAHHTVVVKALDWFIKYTVISIGNNRWCESGNYCQRDKALLGRLSVHLRVAVRGFVSYDDLKRKMSRV